MRLDAAGGLRVLSAMVGNSTKFNRPERPEDRLDLVPGRVFEGAYTINPIGPATAGAVTQ